MTGTYTWYIQFTRDMEGTPQEMWILHTHKDTLLSGCKGVSYCAHGISYTAWVCDAWLGYFIRLSNKSYYQMSAVSIDTSEMKRTVTMKQNKFSNILQKPLQNGTKIKATTLQALWNSLTYCRFFAVLLHSYPCCVTHVIQSLLECYVSYQ